MLTYSCFFFFRNDFGELFLNALVGFLNLSFKFPGMFSLFIPLLYTSFSINESIRSYGSSHLRSITSFLHRYLHLTKLAQDEELLQSIFFLILR